MTPVDCAGALLSIDLNALVENYRLIARRVAPAEVAGVVKADAYGTGASAVAAALLEAGCRRFFVAQLEEAIALKPELPDSIQLFVLNGLQPGAERHCRDAGAIPVLNSLDQIRRWSQLAQASGRTLPAALQVDSGMARLGLSPDEVRALLADRSLLDGIELVLILSHLACADDPSSAFNDKQVAAFNDFTRHFPGVSRSLDNSGGSFLNHPHYEVVRAGIALYGGAPQDSANPMHPVVSLEARIAQLRTVGPGTGVGYGLSHLAEETSHIATIPVGYADGWPRHLSNRGSAFIGGIRVPIVGRVSMDSMTLDVTHVPDMLLYPGAPVELLGPHQSIDDVAADAGTISYEILTQLGHRYRREYRLAEPAEQKRSMTA